MSRAFGPSYLPGQQITRRSAYAAPIVGDDGSSAPVLRARAIAPSLSPATIATADASQNNERQTQMRYENEGITPRSPSPSFVSSQKAKIARGIAPQIGTVERPSLVPGERNPTTGLTSADARANNANFHSNSASMTLTDQQARAMYKTAMAANPGNLPAGQKQFHDTVAKYGVNGHALLDTWHGAPQTDFVRGFSETAPQPIKDQPYASGAQTGKTVDGRAVMVDANGQQVGGTMMQQSPIPPTRTPVMGPKSGYDPLPARDMIAPTARLDAPDQHYGEIRDEHRAPPSVAPSFTTDSSSAPQYSFTDPDTLPQAASRSVPNLADEAIQAPVRMQESRDQGLLNREQTKQNGARDVAAGHDASAERRTNATTQSSADRNASQERQTQTRANATTQASADRSAVQKEIGAGHDAATTQRAQITANRPGAGGTRNNVNPSAMYKNVQSALANEKYAAQSDEDRKAGKIPSVSQEEIRKALVDTLAVIDQQQRGPSSQPAAPVTQPSTPQADDGRDRAGAVSGQPQIKVGDLIENDAGHQMKWDGKKWNPI